MTNHLRGHKITLSAGIWRYADTGAPTAATWRTRPCGHCGQHDTPEGHDACLGRLPAVKNACCGHGHRREAYAQLRHGPTLRGRAARAFFALARHAPAFTLYLAILAVTALFWWRLEAFLSL
ncbi:hypothetical protein [Martelella soudanensis]|uniref:hypothetical protein n=1 Tax=unclassified Martelella TaxID=2629616 RepID=UPI0015DE915A|nr:MULTISPECIES: hypothetical protein [unclassified Martelella]